MLQGDVRLPKEARDHCSTENHLLKALFFNVTLFKWSACCLFVCRGIFSKYINGTFHIRCNTSKEHTPRKQKIHHLHLSADVTNAVFSMHFHMIVHGKPRFWECFAMDSITHHFFAQHYFMNATKRLVHKIHFQRPSSSICQNRLNFSTSQIRK